MPIFGLRIPARIGVMTWSRRVSRDAREARWLAREAYLDSRDDPDALESFAAR
jgi:hypothetical protein